MAIILCVKMFKEIPMASKGLIYVLGDNTIRVCGDAQVFFKIMFGFCPCVHELLVLCAGRVTASGRSEHFLSFSYRAIHNLVFRINGGFTEHCIALSCCAVRITH